MSSRTAQWLAILAPGDIADAAQPVLTLPFLPMLPTQILLNNFLSDLAQFTIPTDSVDPSFTHKPHHWDISLIRDFMLFIGSISSIYDFLTFFVMPAAFHASEALIHAGWFVESLATQTLALFVIRTAGNPLRSRSSRSLVATTQVIVIIGMLLPFTLMAGALGFVALPAAYIPFLHVVTSAYSIVVEVGKRCPARPDTSCARRVIRDNRFVPSP
jgi:Mg2+-importing ATPase